MHVAKAALTLVDILLMVYVLIYIKQLRLYVHLYTKKQHVFLLRNIDLYSIYTFQIKSSLI